MTISINGSRATRPKHRQAFTTLTWILLAVGCGGEPKGAPEQAAPNAVPVAPAIPGPSATPTRRPDRYRVAVETNKGTFTIDVTRALAPLGADRFHELVTIGYFSDVRFFRMVPGFIAQFGVHGDPAVYAVWSKATLADEPMRAGNTRGTVAFATSGPDSRSVQLFVSTGDNRRKLDGQLVFSPIGTVVSGMEVVDSLNSEYGEEPNYSRLAAQGNAYLAKWFPALDYIKSARIVPITPP